MVGIALTAASMSSANPGCRPANIGIVIVGFVLVRSRAVIVAIVLPISIVDELHVQTRAEA
jgi:hypothetical protein